MGRPARRRRATRSMPMPTRNMATIVSGIAAQTGTPRPVNISTTYAPIITSAPCARLGTDEDL
jgi:hypothetical protein